jgi:2-polyprenyl-3-methyl-5-hydroxy-6-metoxy-1,4-benzoquinol methylase
MDIQNAYNEWSYSYDQDENRTRDLDRDVVRKKLSGLHFYSILEIGCGTGKNTSFLAEIGQSVRAVDFSEGMIARAREKVKAENVHFSIMDITQHWKLTDESFDLIVCNLVLEHIQDLSHIFFEAGRTLRPGGHFFIDELHPFRQYEGTKARFYRAEEKVEVDAFVHHISDFLKAAEESRLSLIGLEEFWHETDENKPPRILSLYFERR